VSRPKPSVLLDFTDPKTYKSEQVLEAEAIYAVFYKGKPINLRSLKNSLLNDSNPKYKKASFQNSGHAFNLMEKLNRLFKTDKFEVFKFTIGEKITENK
jgi:hypothetical protein